LQVLDPVLGKQTIRRGRALVMKIGDAEVEYDSRFRLYLQVCRPPQGTVGCSRTAPKR
jgi:hypothetical protein